jgi:hypothetical protein
MRYAARCRDMLRQHDAADAILPAILMPLIFFVIFVSYHYYCFSDYAMPFRRHATPMPPCRYFLRYFSITLSFFPFLSFPLSFF